MMTNIITPISQDTINHGFTYSEFSLKVEQLLAEGKATDGDTSESMLNYTKLNIQRTNRWDKRAVLGDELVHTIQSLERKLSWVVLTEGWCGDSAQILPFINKMAELSDNIELRIILREEHPEVMDQFLTDGKSRSIPKLIILDTETLEVLGDWGPRPLEIHASYLAERVDANVGGKIATQNLHLWYARDKGKVVQEELNTLLKSF